MTSIARTPDEIAELFGTDPLAAVARVIREAKAPLTATTIKGALRSGGVSELDDRVWRRLQRQLRAHEHVAMDGRRYAWVAKPSAPSAIDVLVELVRLAGSRIRPSHLKIIEDVLVNTPGRAQIAARQHQAVIDGARKLADLASEVEELIANQADDEVVVHRVRTHAILSSLEPIERAGETVAFDPKIHKPISPPIAEASSVRVVRPGYVWRKRREEVLICKAEVQE